MAYLSDRDQTRPWIQESTSSHHPLTDFQYQFQKSWCREQDTILVGEGTTELYSNNAVILFSAPP
jgi:hypothetical protein